MFNNLQVTNIALPNVTSTTSPGSTEALCKKVTHSNLDVNEKKAACFELIHKISIEAQIHRGTNKLL